MHQFSPAEVPVHMKLAQEFALMDKYYTSFPGPSTPNHLFIMSATSAGCTTTGEDYQCTSGKKFPQKTIFESLARQVTWPRLGHGASHAPPHSSPRSSPSARTRRGTTSSTTPHGTTSSSGSTLPRAPPASPATTTSTIGRGRAISRTFRSYYRARAPTRRAATARTTTTRATTSRWASG